MWHPAASLYLSSVLFGVMAICLKALSGAPAAAGFLRGHDLPAVELVFFRSLIPIIFLLPLCRRVNWAEVRPALAGLIVRGGAGALSMLTYFLAMERISLSGACMTANTSPLWAGAMAAVLYAEATPGRLYMAFPVCFAGAALVAGVDVLGPGGSSQLEGYGLGLVSAFLAGIAYATLRKLRHLNPAVVVLSLSLVGTLAPLPQLAAIYVPPTPVEWGLVLVMGLAASLAQLCMTIGYRYNTAARASTLNLASVGVTTLLAALVLGERLAPLQWAGMALLASGTVLATSGKAE